MREEKEPRKCVSNKDVLCGNHKVMEERRSADRLRIDRHEHLIGSLLTFRNILYGCSFLGVLVICGSYLYTHDFKLESVANVKNNTAGIIEVRKSVSSLETKLAIVATEYKHSSAIQKEQNLLIRKLIDKLDRQ